MLRASPIFGEALCFLATRVEDKLRVANLSHLRAQRICGGPCLPSSGKALMRPSASADLKET